MKVALQLRCIPGKTVRDKQKWALDHGVDGIELSAWDYGPDELSRARQDFENSVVPICSISDNLHLALLDPLPERRRQCISYVRSYLQLAGDLGAVGHTVTPILGPLYLHDLSPWMDAVTLAKYLLVEQCKEIGDIAAAYDTNFLLKPTNHYQQRLLYRLGDGAEIVKRCGHDRIGLTSDFFHMYITEPDIPQAIRVNGAYIKHVHLADNTGLEPGTGDFDFLSAFRALLDIDFNGYMVLTCSISHDDQGAGLAKSIAFVKEMINQARASQSLPKGEIIGENCLAAQFDSRKHCQG